MSESDVGFLMVFFGYFLLAIAATGIVFILDALLFGLTGRSFIGILDRWMH